MNLERLLLVRADRIGDLMHVTPLLEALRVQHPRLAVDVLCRTPALSVLEGNPAVRRLLDARWDDARLAGAIEAGGYDAVVHLFPDARLVRLCRRIGRTVRKGWLPWPFPRRRVVLHRSRSAKSEALYNADLVAPLLPGLQVDPRPRIYPGADHRAFAARILGAPRPILNPGSGHPEGAWHPERFAETARLLGVRLGRPLIVWGPGERELAERVAREGGGELAPETDLRTLAALFERASVVVTNDTGPMHLAAAAGAPLVVVWDGSRAIRPKRWGHHFRPDIIHFDPFDGTSDRPDERLARLGRVAARDVAAAALRVARDGSAAPRAGTP